MPLHPFAFGGDIGACIRPRTPRFTSLEDTSILTSSYIFFPMSTPAVLEKGMPVEKVKYTYLVVDDMDAAVAFYRDGLGLKLKFQDGQRWAEFDGGIL